MTHLFFVITYEHQYELDNMNMKLRDLLLGVGESRRIVSHVPTRFHCPPQDYNRPLLILALVSQ